MAWNSRQVEKVNNNEYSEMLEVEAEAAELDKVKDEFILEADD